MTNKKTHKLRFAIIATDTLLFAVKDKKLYVLLIPVNIPGHYKNYLGIPGGLVDPKETTEEAALRNIRNKGGVDPEYLEQLYTFSDVNRDPRGRVVSTAYIALVPPNKMEVNEAGGAKWFLVKKLPAKIAYDHREIIKAGVGRLKSKLEYTNIAFALLPREFTLAELKDIYETVLGRKFDKRNFQKKILSLGLVTPLRKKKKGVAHRPPQLYKFKTRKPKVFEII